jgi:UDP-N-acetylmuramoyl-L-alanyl-D-glutamate--2,6-diaminopimelate ligase
MAGSTGISAGKTLAELGLTAQTGGNVEISGLCVDSREVKPGYLFAALPGTRIHGGTFIQYALRMGADAILTDREGAQIASMELAASKASLIIAEDPRQTLWRAARCDGRDHRHQRQNLGGKFHPPNLGIARYCRC